MKTVKVMKKKIHLKIVRHRIIVMAKIIFYQMKTQMIIHFKIKTIVPKTKGHHNLYMTAWKKLMKVH